MRGFIFLPSCVVLPVAADPSCGFVVARSFALSRLCAGLCYWLIESVFGAAALPRRLVLARAHCNRTNENTPHHLPSRDTPSPSPCPSTLLSPDFLFLFPVQLLCFHPPASEHHIFYSVFLFNSDSPLLPLPLYFALFRSLLRHLPS